MTAVNAHLPMRTAQQYMQAYTKFGIDPEISKLGAGHIIRLLPMSDEERELLLAAGFSEVSEVFSEGSTVLLLAKKP